MTPTTLEYARCFGTLDIIDAELIGDHGIAFLVGAGIQRRLVLVDARRSAGERWRSVDLDEQPASIGRSLQDRSPVLVADAWRLRTFTLDGEQVDDEALQMDREDRGGCRGGIGRLRQFNDQGWACGANRTLGIRHGHRDWRWWTDAIPLGAEPERLAPGFCDVDGFGDGDVYAVDGHEIWRMRDLRWEKVRNAQPRRPLTRVCCGGDGQVYLGSPVGRMLRGRDEKWAEVKGSDPLAQFNDLAWFEDQLWATGIYAGVWTVEGGRMRRARLPSDIGGYDGQGIGGHLSVHGGRMLLAGKRGAALLENGQWRLLLDTPQLIGCCRADGSLAQAEAERKAARMAAAAPVETPRVAAGAPPHPAGAPGAAGDHARLQVAIDAFNGIIREHAERHYDDAASREHWIDNDSLRLGSGTAVRDVESLQARLKHPLPPDLRAFYLQFGSLRNGIHYSESYELQMPDPAALLAALDAPHHCDRQASLGLIHSVRHRWSNDREELEPGICFSDAEIDALNQCYTVFGRYNRSEGLDAAGYLFFDRAGRFGRIWFSQDGCYSAAEQNFFDHCDRLLQESTATHSLASLLVEVIDDMRQWMRNDIEEEAESG
jgi:hypothetical protein